MTTRRAATQKRGASRSAHRTTVAPASSGTGTAEKHEIARRMEEIDDWWEHGFPGAFPVKSRMEPRIRKAFRAVLLAMSDDDFDQFFRRPPTLVCQPRTKGCVFRLWVPHLPGEEDGSEVVIIYLNAELLAKESEATLVRTVAHECAHFVRGDSVTCNVDKPLTARPSVPT